MSYEIRRATGSPDKDIRCKFCSHGKVWHDFAGCHVSDDDGFSCDCEAWDYGTNVETIGQ